MKKVIFTLALALIPFGSIALAHDTGESHEETSATTSTPPRAVTGSSNTQTTGGNVEYGWKVEEGESAPAQTSDGVNVMSGDVNGDGTTEGRTDALLEIKGVEGETTKNTTTGVEPDEIDFNNEQKTNFAILLSSGGGNGGSKGGARAEEVLGILKDGLDDEGVAAEQISLNFEKISTKVKHELKLFGLIPIQTTATVEVDGDENVKVKFPWWSFLASGKNGDSVGQQVFTALSNVLKTKHDTLMNIINSTK